MPDITKHSPDEFLDNFRAQPRSAPVALYAGAALDRAGRLEEALAVWTLGDDADPLLRTVHKHPQASADLRAHSKRADEAIRAHFTALHQNTVADFARTRPGEDIDRVRNGIWVQYAVEPFQFREPKQRPFVFYMPDLPAQPVTQADALPWAGAVEAAYGDILAEYEAAVAADATQYPYVPENEPNAHWEKLRGKMDWSALYINFNAEVTDEAAHFPKTIKALKNAPLVNRDGVPLETFFSRLQPGAHIPPHCGLTNSRLTVHLPIIAPEDCQIRVGDTMNRWEEGKIIAFDDSYEHEAWNRSDRDRIVLIFETHHPDLKPAEIEAIELVYSVFDKWVRGRADVLDMKIEGLNV